MRKFQRIIACLFATLVTIGAGGARAGQLRFSKEPIKDPKSGNYSTHFKSGDPIYVLAEFDDTLGEEMGAMSEPKAKVIEVCVEFAGRQGQKVCQSTDLKPSDMGRKWIALTIVPVQSEPPSLKTKGMLDFFADMNKSEQQVRITAGRQSELAAMFVMDYTAGIEGYSAWLHAFDMAKALPVSHMKDAKLEKELTALVKARESDEYEIYKVVITSDEWTLTRHTITNEVLGRTLGFSVFAKKKSTGECMVRSMGGGEDSVGKGHFGKLNIFTGESVAPMPCERFTSKK